MSHAFVIGTGPGAVSFSYGHDAAGKTTTIGVNQPAFDWMPTLAYARSYGVANVLNQVASEGGVAIAFNGDGNMTSDGVNTYSWTFGNRMSGATRTGMTAVYDYDSDNRRTKKTVNNLVTRTMWSGADEMAELDASGNVLRRFVPDGSGAMDGRLATVEANGTVYWHHTDHQGSVIATSNSAGQTVETATYSPFGEFGAGVTAPPQGSPFGYTGRQYDVETGLYQYRARYYSPRLGQFLSMDPVGTKDDPNLYLYVGLDPVNATDPTGECKEVKDSDGNVIGAVGICAATDATEKIVDDYLSDPHGTGAQLEQEAIAAGAYIEVNEGTRDSNNETIDREGKIVDGAPHVSGINPQTGGIESYITLDLSDDSYVSGRNTDGTIVPDHLQSMMDIMEHEAGGHARDAIQGRGSSEARGIRAENARRANARDPFRRVGHGGRIVPH